MVKLNSIMQLRQLCVVLACVMLCGCEQMTNFDFLPSISDLWSDEEQEQEKPTKDAQEVEKSINPDQENAKKISSAKLPIDANALISNVIPQAQKVDGWNQEGANYIGNMAASAISEVSESATVGEGYDWIESAIPPSVVTDGKIVVAMDGNGYISAHNADDLEVLWQSEAIISDDPLLTGGLAIDEAQKTVIAVNAHGKLVALNLKDGKDVWQQNLKEPIRSSIRVADSKLFIVTADSQLLCFDSEKGTPIWQHRAIAQTSGVFGTSLPAVNDAQTIAAFPSGDLVGLLPKNGETIWVDSLQKLDAGKENPLFSGVDANPILEDRLMVAGNLVNLTIAYDAQTGTRIWELPFGISHTPWIAGDGLFMINHKNQLVGLNKYRGVAAWVTKIKSNSEDKIIKLFGAFLINGQLVILTSSGQIMAFAPESGKKLWERELGYEIAASPAFAGDKAFLLTHDATLLLVK